MKKPNLQKCPICKSKDGKRKDIYKTYQEAVDAVKYFKNEHQLGLNIYECEHGYGWHLTKDSSFSVDNINKRTILHKDNIPTISIDGSWIFIEDDQNKDNNTITKKNKKLQYNSTVPILTIEAANKKTLNITGTIKEN